VNPAARGGRAAEDIALAAFRAIGAEPEVQRTTASGDAARLVAAAATNATVYVLGGDGTVMEVASASVGTGRIVGILPGGTGNQLARHLGIPLHIGRAVRALQRSVVRTLDLGRLADGRHFAITAGMGMDAAMIAGASKLAKRWLGVGSYVLSGAGPVLAATPFPVRIVADGKLFEREAGLAMIANIGSVMGGRLAFGPGIVPDDGFLDVCVFSPRSVADGLGLALRLLRHDFRDDSRLFFVRAKEVRIEAPEGVPAQADGELIGGSTLEARVVAGGATFLAPTP
jgi:YegS/Rv2252/BmrU family lipid kinase